MSRSLVSTVAAGIELRTTECAGPSAPQNYDAAACNNFCVRNGSGIIACNLSASGSNNERYSMSSNVAGFDGPIDGGSGNDGCDNPGGGAESNCNRAYNSNNFTPWSPLVCP